MAWAILVAGGEGSRFGREGGKQLAGLGGVTVMGRALSAVIGCPEVSGVVLVCHPDRLADYETEARLHAAGKPLAAVVGGDTRRASVAAGLAGVPLDEDMVVVHDGARPLATPSLVSAVLTELAAHPEADGVVVGTPSSDTVKLVENGVVLETPDRRRVWAVQTPQAFRAAALREAHEAAARDGFGGTDDASLVERRGGTVRVIEGPRANLKVTHADDLSRAEALLEEWREIDG